jgi:Outer membrane protein beta-barrel domain
MTMKKIVSAFCFIFISSVFVFAQSKDYKKAEFFIGFSNGQIDTGLDTNNFLDDRLNFNGFNASATVNVNRYVGFTGDVSGTYRKDVFSEPTPGGNIGFRAKSSLYNALGGIQIKDNASTARVKPFGYALVGAGIGRVKVDNVVCPAGIPNCLGFDEGSETGLAGAFGGGLDIKINDRVDFRLIKIDYNPIKFQDGTQHNMRIGIGIVFK